MKIRQLVAASGLYGIADVLVVAVGGFLLLPLYTRALSPADFGAFVVVRTNSEIIGYCLYLGLVSAVSRLYFDYRDSGRDRAYVRSVLVFFLAVFLAALALAAIAGPVLWGLLSPEVPARPFLWYALALVAMGFLSQLGALWLRLDARVSAFVAVQVFSALLLAAAAWAALVAFDLGLPGLLGALILGLVPPTVVLLVRLGGELRPRFDRALVMPSLKYGIPFAVSYIAYFLLNRFSLVVLQRHATLDDIAIFGLAQQVGLIIAIGSQSFGKALQPAVYGAKGDEARELLRKSSRLFILLMFGLSALLILFARELIWIIAPAAYGARLDVVLVLLLASYVYSLSMVSGTTLDYYRRPKLQAAVYVLGALVSVAAGLALIPRFGLFGGAGSVLAASAVTSMVGHVLAYRLSRHSFFAEILMVTAVLGALALAAVWPGWQALPLTLLVAAKLALGLASGGLLLAVYAPHQFGRSLAWLRRKLAGTARLS